MGRGTGRTIRRVPLYGSRGYLTETCNSQTQIRSEVPDEVSVQEAGDQAVFAHLQDRAEVAGSHGSGRACPLGGGQVGQIRGIVAEDGSKGDQSAGRVSHERSVDAGQRFQNGRIETSHAPATGQVVQG